MWNITLEYTTPHFNVLGQTTFDHINLYLLIEAHVWLYFLARLFFKTEALVLSPPARRRRLRLRPVKF